MSADRPTSTDLEITRIVRSWLRTDEHESADRVLAGVLAHLDATPQRRPSWPARRIADMNLFAKLAAAAVIVVAVAVVGYQLLPTSGAGVGGPIVSPSPSTSPSPSPSSSAGQAPLPVGALEPRTPYHYDTKEAAVTVEVPTAGWSNDFGWLHKSYASGQVEVSIYGGGSAGTPGIFTDACAHTGLRQFEDSIAGQAEAVAALPGVDVLSAPSETTIDGRSATTVAISVPTDIGCAHDQYWLAYDPTCGVKVECTEYPTWLGSKLHYWFVDMGPGRRLTIRAESRSPANAEADAEFQQIVESIRFESQ